MSKLVFGGVCRDGHHHLARSGTFHPGDAVCRCGHVTAVGHGRITDGTCIWPAFSKPKLIEISQETGR